MDLSYGTSTYDRTRGNFPSMPVVNMFAEQVPTEHNVVLQSRPGLENTTSMGSGPIKYLYQSDGVLSNALFGVSDNKLYSSSTNLGTINGAGPAKIAAFETRVFATQGKSLYEWNGAFSTVATPGSFDVLDLCVGASRLVVIDKGTGKFYWSDALSDTIDALSFATAENSPDNLKACLYVGDVLYLFGSQTVELWPVATDPAAPFQPLIGRVYPVGIKDTGCAVQLGASTAVYGPQSAIAWVSNKNQVCVGNPTSIASQPDLEAKIAAANKVSLWSFMLEGTEFLAVRLDTATHVLNTKTKTWSEFKSYGKTNFIPQCWVNNVFGSSLDGQLLRWTNDHSDLGSVLERRFRAGAPIDSGTIPLSNVSLRTNPGQTSFVIPPYDNPTVELRLSKDGGFTWSPWKPRSLGLLGHYRDKVQWRSLGMFSHPGVLIEFRVTDPVPFRVSGVSANDPYGDV